MFENNPGRVIGGAVDDENLTDHTRALQTFLAPLDEFTHRDFFIQRRDDDAQFYAIARGVSRHTVFDNRLRDSPWCGRYSAFNSSRIAAPALPTFSNNSPPSIVTLYGREPGTERPTAP